MDASAQTRAWTIEEVRIFTELARERVAAPLIAMKMKRNEAELHAKAAELGLSLAPAPVEDQHIR